MIYRNHRGEVAYRRIFPARLWYGSTEWHPEPQFFIHGMDMDSHKPRDFALADVLYSWPGSPPAARAYAGYPPAALTRLDAEIGEWAAAMADLPASHIGWPMQETAAPRPEDPPLEGL
jgi:hypothetical protein